VWLEGLAVGFAKGVGEFLARVGEIVAEGLGCEVEGAIDFSGRLECWNGRTYRVSQRRPSVAVCFFSLSSLITRSCSVSESAGAASCRSRIFYNVLVPSFPHNVSSTCLDVANHIVLDRLESCRAKDVFAGQLHSSFAVWSIYQKASSRYLPPPGTRLCRWHYLWMHQQARQQSFSSQCRRMCRPVGMLLLLPL